MTSVFVKQFSSLWFDTYFTDCTIVVGTDTFHAHRVVLAARSSVFNAMLKTPMKEGKTNEINITDATPKTFKAFLEFMYTDSIVTYSTEDIITLVTLADKYDVESLIDYLVHRVVCPNMAMKLAEVCIKRGTLRMQYVIDSCVKKIGPIDEAFLKTETFKAFP